MTWTERKSHKEENESEYVQEKFRWVQNHEDKEEYTDDVIIREMKRKKYEKGEMMKTQERRVNSRRKMVIRKQQKYISLPNQTQSVTITLWSKVFWMNSASVQAKAWLTVNSLSIDSAACCVCVCMCVRFIADSISPQVIVIMETQPLSHNTATLHLRVCVSLCVLFYIRFIYFRRDCSWTDASILSHCLLLEVSWQQHTEH